MKKQKNTPPSWAEIIAEKQRQNEATEPKKYFYEDYTAEELLNLEAYYEEQKQLIKQENEL